LSDLGADNGLSALLCYKLAFEGLKLNRGLAIELCGEGRKLQ
jgi:hypothetical protein